MAITAGASEGASDGDSATTGACEGFGAGAGVVERKRGTAVGTCGRLGKESDCVGEAFAMRAAAAVRVGPSHDGRKKLS